MNTHNALVLLCVVGYLALCCGYEIGAPLIACETMFPTLHNASSQTGPSPYTITVNTTRYKNGDTVEVTLAASSSNEFEGFFIQARRADLTKDAGVPLGSFQFLAPDSQVKTLNCPRGKGANNAVTHTSDSDMQMKKFLWSDPEGGDVIFQATVVNDLKTFWTNVRSAIVKDTAEGANNTAASSQSTAASTTVQNSTGKQQTNAASSFFLNSCLFLGLVILLTM